MKKILAAGGLVFNEKNELLMIFRRGKWDLPKGKMETGESPETSAIREVQEETGIKNVHICHFTGITHHEYFDTYLKEKVLKETHWFSMLAASTEILVPQTEEDITAIQWVAKNEMDELQKNTFPNIKHIIAADQERNA